MRNAMWVGGGIIGIGDIPMLGAGAKGSPNIFKELFINGEQGFYYDPNDLSTMFQDAAGTVPVTDVEQPVGLILDKSGRNNHAFQTTSAYRPILRQNAVTGASYLEFDGVDDFLQTNSINFTVTDKMSLFAGIRKLSDDRSASVVETGTRFNDPMGGFKLEAPKGIGATSYGVGISAVDISGVTGVVAPTSFNGYAAPNSAVLTSKMDLSKETSTDQLKFRINTVDKTFLYNGSAKGGNFANTSIYVGRRAGISLPFTGHIYGLICVGKSVSDTETTAIEEELAKQVGVTL